jgi:ATP/maltotriose-dependent transcriptional regulator MalT
MVDALPLIQTKQHRPSLPRDLVARPRLAGLLGIPPQRPLTLVSAPAGSAQPLGKATQVRRRGPHIPRHKFTGGSGG